MGVSEPVADPGQRSGAKRYRVLVFGSDAELAWDVILDASGAVLAVRQVMYHVS
jgi:hypothetical protein